MPKSHRELPRLAWVAPGWCLTSGLIEALDCLEAAVRLDHSQEHLIRAPIAGGAVNELEASEVEGAGFLHGFDQSLSGRFAIDLFERCDDRATDKIALKGNEAGLGIGRAGLERRLVAANDRDRPVVRERNNLG